VKGNRLLISCNRFGIPKTGKVIPENDKLTAVNPDPKVSASLKLLLSDIKSKAKVCDAIIKSSKLIITKILFPAKGKYN